MDPMLHAALTARLLAEPAAHGLLDSWTAAHLEAPFGPAWDAAPPLADDWRTPPAYTADDWRAGQANPARLGLKTLPDPDTLDRLFGREAPARRTALGAACAMARRNPYAWAAALAVVTPDRFDPKAHPPMRPDPLLGWGSALTLRPFAGGVGGLRLAYAVRDAALTGRWGVPSMPCATGGDTPIPDTVWGILDRFGYRPAFNPGPDF